jgi:DNA-directed RNA polymerase subunit E"
MKKKVCKKCKAFAKDGICPICKSSDLSENWQGRIYIVDPAKSQVGEKAEIEQKGEYAIKTR